MWQYLFVSRSQHPRHGMSLASRITSIDASIVFIWIPFRSVNQILSNSNLETPNVHMDLLSATPASSWVALLLCWAELLLLSKQFGSTSHIHQVAKYILQQISGSVTWDAMSFSDIFTWYLGCVPWESNHNLTSGAWAIQVWGSHLVHVVLLSVLPLFPMATLLLFELSFYETNVQLAVNRQTSNRQGDS